MSINPFLNTRIEFHILQSFPVTCLNRDDVGSPKTAVVGGVTRARVSSQCWKRQVRMMLHEFGVKIGTRSKLVNQQIAAKCRELGATDEQAQACGDVIAKAIVKDTLYFFTDTEVEEFAAYAQSKNFDAGAVSDKDIQKRSKKVLKLAVDGLDIALFGRMVAQAPELNVQAAASFSHAISTHAVNNEIEFFTALDDLDTAAGHLDNLEFSSATYYRYVSLDLGQLYESLQGEQIKESVQAFTRLSSWLFQQHDRPRCPVLAGGITRKYWCARGSVSSSRLTSLFEPMTVSSSLVSKRSRAILKRRKNSLVPCSARRWNSNSAAMTMKALTNCLKP